MKVALVQCVIVLVHVTLLLAEDSESNEVYRYRDNFFVGNQTYSVNYIGHILLNRDCGAIPYTHIVREKGCFPVYIKNNLCGGLCQSVAIPKQNKQSKYLDNDTSTCVACGPGKLVEKVVRMMCKTKNRTDTRVSKFRMQKKMVRVVENCACQSYKCPKYWKAIGNIRG